ncbi:GAF domain-containing protein [Aestuariivirga litoralis]|uniref:GAF domain-containing protein n=1 Tax=Aestuariivirga litoralis TaxID=2650924 RepID=UPI001FF07471|nr:GAF domain-containing protein [Aestuariivirga litoralis]
MTNAAKHVDDVQRALQAGAAALSPVAASWSRSSHLHSLSPERDLLPQRVEDAELKRDRDALGRLLEAARPSLDQIFELVGHAGCSVVMANNDGVVLERRGKMADDDTFERWGLWTGTVWSERSQGTNAIGTSIVEGRPVVIYKDQHFLSRNTVLSCMTAPIYDEYGSLAAVVDVSSCRPELSEEFARVICSLAVDAAHRIETQNFNLAFAGNRIVMLPEAAKRAPTLLAIDKHDIVIGATYAARKVLGLPPARKLNVPAPELFGQNPEESDTFDGAERGVLLRALERNGRNMTQTAKAIGLSRATLYRKLTQHGLLNDAEI